MLIACAQPLRLTSLPRPDKTDVASDSDSAGVNTPIAPACRRRWRGHQPARPWPCWRCLCVCSRPRPRVSSLRKPIVEWTVEMPASCMAASPGLSLDRAARLSLCSQPSASSRPPSSRRSQTGPAPPAVSGSAGAPAASPAADGPLEPPCTEHLPCLPSPQARPPPRESAPTAQRPRAPPLPPTCTVCGASARPTRQRPRSPAQAPQHYTSICRAPPG
jgi:hypothetical protein